MKRFILLIVAAIIAALAMVVPASTAIAATAVQSYREFLTVQSYDCSQPNGGLQYTDHLIRQYHYAADGNTKINGPWALARTGTRTAPGLCKGIDPANLGQVNVHFQPATCTAGTYAPARLVGNVLPDEEASVNADYVHPDASGHINRIIKDEALPSSVSIRLTGPIHKAGRSFTTSIPASLHVPPHPHHNPVAEGFF